MGKDDEDESEPEDVTYDDTDDGNNMEDYNNNDCIIFGKQGKNKLW